MNRAFSESGIAATYTSLRVESDSLLQTIDDLRDMDFTGVNVTYPHKEAILACVDRPSKHVEVLKAANTLHFTKDEILAYNTDATGTVVALQRFGNIELEGKKVLIFGAGGAARAAAYGVLEAGAETVTFLVRDPSRAEESISHLRIFFAGKNISILSTKSKKMHSRREAAIIGSDILINATPVGMVGESPEAAGDGARSGAIAGSLGPSPSLVKDPGWIRPAHCCFDFVYHPRETEFLKMAKARGAKRLDGLKLLVAQASEGFRCWTGRPFDLDKMTDALESHLAGGGGLRQY